MTVNAIRKALLRPSQNLIKKMSNVTWVPDASIESLLERSSKDTKWSTVNSSTAGHRTVKVLPTGTADIQLYSLATPVSALQCTFCTI